MSVPTMKESEKNYTLITIFFIIVIIIAMVGHHYLIALINKFDDQSNSQSKTVIQDDCISFTVSQEKTKWDCKGDECTGYFTTLSKENLKIDLTKDQGDLGFKKIENQSATRHTCIMDNDNHFFVKDCDTAETKKKCNKYAPKKDVSAED